MLPVSSSVWWESDFNVGLSDLSLYFIVGLIAIFFLLSFCFTTTFNKPTQVALLVKKLDRNKAIKFQINLCMIWYSFFIVEIFFSGGLPFFWSDGRTYVNFGIPTLHGLSNMIRCLIFANISIFVLVSFKPSKLLILSSLLPLMCALVLEQSRGAFLMTLCFAIPPIIIFKKISIVPLLKGIGLSICIFLALAVTQFLRLSDDPLEELGDIYYLVTQDGQTQKYLLDPVLFYIATPALNAGLNIDVAPVFDFNPRNTLISLLPSVIRTKIMETPDDLEDHYGKLISPTYNTTSFITPFVRDFGWGGASLIFCAFFFYCNYAFVRARYGSIKHLVQLGPLTLCLALSFFTSYLTSLVTIVYLLASGAIARRMS